MREVPRDEKFPQSPDDLMSSAPNRPTGPSESELVIISLLMRLYDLNLALLTHFDEKQAGEVYEAHERGETFNPRIFIPDMTPEDEL